MTSGFTTFPLKPLRELLSDADSGTWGDEAEFGTGQPVLRSTNISGGRLSFEEPAWRLLSDSHKLKKKLAHGDIIVTSSSGSTDHIGKCAIFESPSANGQDYYFSNFTLRLRSHSKKLSPKWLFYWLSSPRGRHEMSRLNNTTSGLRNLSKAAYLAQKIPLPSVEEQDRIAAILDNADAIRRQRQKSIEEVDKLPCSLFCEWFGDPINNPKGFPVFDLGELIALLGGFAFRSDAYQTNGIPVIRIGNANNENFQPDKLVFLPESYADEYSRYVLSSGDMIMTLTGTVGKDDYANIVEVPDHYERWLLNQRVAKVTLKSDQIDKHYLIQYLMTPHVKTLIRRMNRGVRQANLRNSDIFSQRIPVPPKELQSRFACLIEQQRKVREKMCRETRESEDLFNSLVQRAFKGEL